MGKLSSQRNNSTKKLLDSKWEFIVEKNSLNAAREKAKSRFEAFGAPLDKDEYWKFSSPQRFTSVDTRIKTRSVTNSLLAADKADEINIFIEDGVLNLNKLDSELNSAGIEIFSINDKSLVNKQWVQDLYGELEAKSHQVIKRPLAAFNTACASGGYLIRVTKFVEKKLIVNYVSNNSNYYGIVHNLIRLEPGANLTLIEKGEGASRLSLVTEIDLLKESSFDHIRVFGHDLSSDVHSQIFVRQAFKSVYNEFSLILNNEFIRNEFHISLEGEEAKVSLAGANLGEGSNVQDDTIFIAHLKKNCESRQVFKKVLKDHATGIFQGKIYVTSEAQKTDGYQISKALLLGTESKFLTKPELEIYADDVVCSHGSTSGTIDEEGLFYLTSRGVSKQEAVNMLILAFLDEAVQEITNSESADQIRNLIRKVSETKSDG